MYKIIGILGLILITAPFMLGYTADVVAFWTNLIFGGLLMVVSYIEGLTRDRGKWEYWVIVLVGFAVILAPFLLIFNNFERAIWLSASIGVLLVILGSIRISYNSMQTRRRIYKYL